MAETIATILKDKGREVWSVAPEATVYDAIATMANKSIGALLVFARGELVGIISERDYARKIILQGKSSKETRVLEIMSDALVTVSPDYTVDECMRIMTSHKVRHLPVVRDGEVVGVISIGDLVNTIIAAQAETIGHLHAYITGGY